MAGVVVTLLAITSATMLVLGAGVLRRTTVDVAEAVESVRIAEEAEISLLLHARADTPETRAELARELRGHLAAANRHITGIGEAASLLEVNAAVAQYLELCDRTVVAVDAPLLSRAVAAIERVVDINVNDTRAAQRRAQRWEQLSTVAGITVAIGIVVITLGLILWLRRRMLDPLFALADTVKRFGTGDRAARAEERGPTEVREMSQRFNGMADVLAAQRQAQVAFLGGIAHDLRNPLSTLKLAVDFVSSGEQLPPEPLLRKTLATIGRQITHLDRMVGDFLDMSKIEAGTLELRLDQHDLRRIVNEAIELFDAGARGRVHVSTPDIPVVVTCDAVRITQAITNLVSNAIKYSPGDAPVDVVVKTHGRNTVTVAVTDRGVGITPDDQVQLFEPFRRGSSQHHIPGTGLGLYNVIRVLQAHGGGIDVSSVPGRGSTFTVRLPCARG